MGDKWEVHAFEGGFPHDNTGSPYRYVQKYRGNSLVKAIIVFIKAKKTSGCVKIEWR